VIGLRIINQPLAELKNVIDNMPYSYDTKPTSSYIDDSKPSSSYDDGENFLLQENAGFILLENGARILLDQSWNNKPYNNYSYDTK